MYTIHYICNSNVFKCENHALKMINNTTDLTFKEKNIKTQFFLCSVYRYYRYTSQEVVDTS